MKSNTASFGTPGTRFQSNSNDELKTKLQERESFAIISWFSITKAMISGSKYVHNQISIID
jgi:hypothetical protein